MAELVESGNENYEQFRDVLSSVLIAKLCQPVSKAKRSRKARLQGVKSVEEHSQAPQQDAEELADFVDYIASEVFAALPEELRQLDHFKWADDAGGLQARYALPLTGDGAAALLPALDPAVADSLRAYGIAGDDEGTAAAGPAQGVPEVLAPALTAYISAATAPPPPPRATRAAACEICGREWIGLTYHHLIPRFVHAKAVRRGWHRPEELQNVAWLCGACHRFVHQFAGHEDLARRYYTVELLLEQDEVRAWAAWVGRLRWKGGSTSRRGR